MGATASLVKKIPSVIKRAYYLAVPFGRRYGRVYRDTYSLINDSQWWSPEKLRDYQWGKLAVLLEYAYSNVPYYRKVFDERGLKPGDIKTISDLQKLPVLTKKIIQDNFYELISTKPPKDTLVLFSTSGSTGTPLKFLGTDSMYKAEAAFVARAYASHNSVLYGEKSAWLRRYVPENENSSPFKYDYELGRLYLSAYHLSLKTIWKYVEKIDKCGARLLVGYPSSCYILALLLEESGLKLKNIRTVHVASEKLLPQWKGKIESVLGVSVKAHYGMMEKVSFFFQCGETTHYHESLEYGVTEFIPDDMGRLAVIGTGFHNYLMPLIRYQTNDYAIVNENVQRCKCGRGLPLTVVDFEGRTDDILITSEGRYIPGVNFYTMMYKLGVVKMFQIVQHSSHEVEVKIIPSASFNEESLTLLKKGLYNRLGDVDLVITVVNEIARDKKTGKIRCIINDYARKSS